MTLPEISIIGVQLFATHLGEMNPGADQTLATPGIYAVTTSGITLGAYRNTLKRTSWQAGYTHDIGKGWAISGGLVTGYTNTKKGYITDPPSKYPTAYVAMSYSFGSGFGGRLITVPVQRTIPVAIAAEWRNR